MRVLQRLAAVTAAALLSATWLVTTGAAPAAAFSSSCTAAATVTYACQETHGDEGYVTKVVAILGQAQKLQNVCKHSARVRISAYGNPNHRVLRKSTGDSCSVLRSWLNFDVNERLPVGSSYVCVTQWVGDVQQGRELCVALTGSVRSLGTFVWRGGHNGQCVDADLNTIRGNGTRVQLWGCNNTRQQNWQRWSDGTVRSSYSGRCVDADLNTIRGNGTRIQLWDCNGSRQQQWYIGNQDGRGWTFQTSFNGRCLDADLNTIGRNGTKVQLWDCNGSYQQRWRTLYY